MNSGILERLDRTIGIYLSCEYMSKCVCVCIHAYCIYAYLYDFSGLNIKIVLFACIFLLLILQTQTLLLVGFRCGRGYNLCSIYSCNPRTYNDGDSSYLVLPIWSEGKERLPESIMLAIKLISLKI